MEKTKTRPIRKLTVLVLVLSIIAALAGCVRYEARARVHQDGTMDFALIYATSSDLGDDLGSGTKDARKVFADAGWDLEEYKEDKYTGFRAIKKDIAIEDLEKELKKTDSFEGFTIRESNGEYTIDWNVGDLKKNATGQGVSASYLEQYGGYMNFVLEVPGDVVETNGKVSSDGKTIEWNIIEMDEPIQATFTLSGGMVFPTRTSVTVNKDKTADVELLFTDVKDMEQFDSLEEMGWDISGKSKVAATQEGVDLEDLEDLLTSTELGFDGFSFKEEEGVYVLEWDASGKAMDLVFELPNEAEDSNADSEDEMILEWDLSEMDEPVSAQFEIKKGGGFPILLVCIIAGSVIVVGVIILVIVLIVRKKKNKGNGPKDPSPVAVTPGAPQQFSPVAPQAPSFPQQYAPQSPAAPQANSPFVPQSPANPASYSSTSGLPNPGLPQMGNVPPQGPNGPQN